MGVGAADDAGRVRVRWPVRGLAHVRLTAPGLAVLVVALAATTFDGVTGTRWWSDVVDGRFGWDAIPLATLGLLASVTAVTAVWVGATAAAARVSRRPTGELLLRFAPSLVPIAAAYTVAHSLTLLLDEWQVFWALASDPFGRGWDLFGTATNLVDYRLLSSTQIAWIQALAVVLGHVAAVVVAHDRAVQLFTRRVAVRSQYVLLAAMVGYTVAALALLLGTT
jgi:hypothetical protein